MQKVNLDEEKVNCKIEVPIADGSSFEGVLSDGNVTTLDDAYVESNFSADFLARVREEGERQTRKFFHLPPGAPRTMEGHAMIDERYPKLK